VEIFVIMKDSKNDDYRFYEDYQPVENVANRLNQPSDDYNLSAPYRDILGILESKEAISKEASITAQNILDDLGYWEDKRSRAADVPNGTKRIKEQLRDLYDDGLVMIKEQEGKKNYYWKIPDEDVPDPKLFKITKAARIFSDNLQYVFCRHEGVVFGVFIYIIGSLLHHFHPIGFELSVVGFIFFLLGHFLAYLGIDLIP